MNESKISVRYAKALFNLAIENKLLDQIKNDIELIYEICEIPDFKEFLISPIIPVSKKQEVFNIIFKNNVTKYVSDFLDLIAKSRREVYLKMISLDFLKLYRELLGIKEANLITAVEISDDTKNQISLMLTKLLNARIDIKNNVDSEIIGGFKLRIDDKQIDASIKNQLNNMKKQLIVS